MTGQQQLVPPTMVRSTAARGLEMCKLLGRGSGSAMDRAASLAKGSPVSLATVRRMAAFYKDANGFTLEDVNGGPSAAAITWQMWGGNDGRDWVDGLLKRGGAVQPMAKGEAIAKSIECKVSKVDDHLGIVFGYAIVCKIDGEDFFDSQGDHIPESAMLDATNGFMEGDRMAKVMHSGGAAGQVVYGFPMTEDIAKALGVEIHKSGFIVGMKPDSDDVLQKFRTGEFTGFSIGGGRVRETVVEG